VAMSSVTSVVNSPLVPIGISAMRFHSNCVWNHT
jgi:hypothetical protein